MAADENVLNTDAVTMLLNMRWKPEKAYIIVRNQRYIHAADNHKYMTP